MIAPQRAQRPGATQPRLEEETPEELKRCPFDEGREDRTPPETFALPEGRQPDTPGWQVRVVPNLYPAFERQDVVVHSPRHVRSLGELSDGEIKQVAVAWKARADAAREEGFAYVHAVINEGRAAGASLPHSHSQLVWLRSAPPAIIAEQGALAVGLQPFSESETAASGEATVRPVHLHQPQCALCQLIAEARDADRIVAVAQDKELFCPPAGRVPYEMIVTSGEIHDADAFVDASELSLGLGLVAEGLRRLHEVEGPVPVNIWLHTAPFGQDGHWHFEVVPRLTVFAGIELGAGIYVNPLPPERAAQALRQAQP